MISPAFILSKTPVISPLGMEPAPFAELDAGGREEFWATLALRHCTGLGARSQARLLKKFGSAKAACDSFRHWRKLGISNTCIENYTRESWRDAARQEWNDASKSSSLILLWKSRIYPASLRELTDAPILLYCRGDPALLSGPCVALVGSRYPAAENMRIAANLAGPLSASGITIVSGMALGIDREAHAAALQGVGRSIGVLGTGIDVEYPKSNADIFAKMRSEGLLLSEFSPGTSPLARNFPIRNRIISGLSLGVVVVEAARRSGSLITARLALEQNREVFAVPGSAFNDRSLGCQNLVRQGARPVFCVDDVLRDLADNLRSYGIQHSEYRENVTDQKHLPSTPDKSVSQPDADTPEALDLLDSDDSVRILTILKDSVPLHIDVIQERTGLEFGRLSAALLALEMLGRIRFLPGSRYEVT